jgi:GTP pyrophosphokinase
VSGREKHISSIYKKMQEKNISFSEVFDIYGFRIIVPDVPSCYTAMGALHTFYKPIPGKFKDYIAIPKANGYQSLHTTLFGPFGMPIELQIRTQDMHKVAEAGVASHWIYKSAEGMSKDVQLKTHQWLQSLLEIQSESGDALEFLEHIKVDLFPDEVYVFSPKGKIFALPKGATAIDFAYSVHTDVGNHCIAAKVDGEPVPLGTVLRNGNRVEILTDPHARPNPVWLSYVATGKARSPHPPLPQDDAAAGVAEVGELLLVQALRSLKANPRRDRRGALGAVLQGRRREDARGGARGHRPRQAPRGRGGRRSWRPSNRATSHTASIRSRSAAPRASPCSSPPAATRSPGDPIIAQIRKGQGLLVHTHDCPAIHPFHFDPEKWVDVQWDPQPDRLFRRERQAYGPEYRGYWRGSPRRSRKPTPTSTHIETEQRASQAYTTLVFTIQVKNRMHLAHVFRRLRRIRRSCASSG